MTIRALAFAFFTLLSCTPTAPPPPPPPPTASLPASRPAPVLAAPPSTLNVPFAATPITCDGEPEEPMWNEAARTGSFRDTTTGALVRPYSDTRMLADRHHLYLLLYAADEDVRVPIKPQPDQPLGALDHFTVQIRRAADPAVLYRLEIAPNRTLYDARITDDHADAHWASHLVLGADLDGTFNNPKDEDEEWLIESALPLASLQAKPGDELLIGIERCDTPKDGVHSCGAWGLDAKGAPVGIVWLPKGPSSADRAKP